MGVEEHLLKMETGGIRGFNNVRDLLISFTILPLPFSLSPSPFSFYMLLRGRACGLLSSLSRKRVMNLRLTKPLMLGRLGLSMMLEAVGANVVSVFLRSFSSGFCHLGP